MIVTAHAKVNLSLRVRPRDRSGYHPLRSLAQSIGWADRITVTVADEDRFEVAGDLPAAADNLAWRAAVAVRQESGARRALAVHLEKRVAVAAGLGGGSADAAAALVATTRVLRADDDLPRRLASGLGSDVPFCLVGGTAWMEGRGEQVTPVPFLPDYALAVVVPPFPLATAEVYRRWDDLDGPVGAAPASRTVPPSLRPLDDLGNDLLPAALDLRPDLGDWMSDLARRWERPVLLTGSGPACFAFFGAVEEAEEAVRVVAGARAAWAGSPSAVGVAVDGPR